MQKDSVQEEIHVVSAAETIVDGQHNRPLLLSDCRQDDKRRPSKGNAPREVVLPELEVKDRARITVKGNCTNPPCGYWHAPVCQKYSSESGCKFGDTCAFRHTEVDSQPRKKSKNKWWKRTSSLVNHIRSQNIWVAYPSIQSRRNRSRIHGRAQNLGDEIAPSDSQQGTLRPKNSGKKESISRSYSEVRTSRTQSLSSKIRG